MENSSFNETLEDLTIVIRLWDSSKTVFAVLDSLLKQEVPYLNVLLVVNKSNDGTKEAIDFQIRTGYQNQLRKRLFEVRPISQRMQDNVPHARKTAISQVHTKYMMFLDADIVLAPNTLRPLINYFKNTPNSGMISIRSEALKVHPTTDTGLFETSVAAGLTWKWDSQGCDCVHVKNQLHSKGLHAYYHPDLLARHLKFL